jgi:prepilin-type N-terminal cleavage/methylation domain-containing protein
MRAHRRSAHAFTLVEMMVTMAIGSILLLVAVSMLGNAGSGYDRGSGGVGAEREGRAVLTQIAGDLSKAVWQEDTVFDKGDGDGWKQAKLGVFSLQPDDAQSDAGRVGDLCAVGYSIKDIQVGGATVRCLMRSFRESDETFSSLKNGNTSALFKPKDEDEPVAFGVISFEITPLTRASSGKWEEWKKPATATPPSTSTTAVSPAPGALRVKLVIARRELIGKMKNSTDWSSQPLLGKPSEPEKNPNLEVYEVIQRFGNDG